MHSIFRAAILVHMGFSFSRAAEILEPGPSSAFVGGPCAVGSVPWDLPTLLRQSAKEFGADLRAQQNHFGTANPGGNGFFHSFVLWFVLKQVRPPLIVESGVLNGHTSWLIERVSQQWNPVIVRIDPKRQGWNSSRAMTHELTGPAFINFPKVKWDNFGVDLSRSLAFFDDHQDHLTRLQEAQAAGFGNALFDDNFVAGFGDIFSIKNACDGGSRFPVGNGSSGGAIRRRFTIEGKTPLRCTRFHRRCRPLSDSDASSARELLLNLTEAIWEGPPLSPLVEYGATFPPSFVPFRQLQRVAKWAEGPARPLDREEVQGLVRLTNPPVFDSWQEALRAVNPSRYLKGTNAIDVGDGDTSSRRRWNHEVGNYVHMVYVRVRL